MLKFTANYCFSNSNFIITNLPDERVRNSYTDILNIVHNSVSRGTPTIASEFLRKELKLERNYLKYINVLRFVPSEETDWEKTIKGDNHNADYPALEFFNDFEPLLNKVGFIRNLTIAEYPITEIITDGKAAFTHQQVDFYIPLLKTVIEVDGYGHLDQQLLDKKRDLAFRKNGVEVLRLTTQQIRNKDYESFLAKFREIYKTHKVKVNLYRASQELDRKEVNLQKRLTEISRLQIFILELMDRGVLSLESENWQFNILTKEVALSLKLALRDLSLWFKNTGALFNLEISLPPINIRVVEKKSNFMKTESAINIDIDVFKRWDDKVNDNWIYYIRTDYDDDANYFSLKTSEPVVYSLTPQKHSRNLSFFLNNFFGFKEFNGGQLDIIINALNGKDTIGLLPTGGGKSLTYQLSVLLQPTVSFVVAPIKALMLDQIENMKEKHHITHTSFVNSDLKAEESSKRLSDFTNGKYSFIIISPERFQTESFRKELEIINRTNSSAFAVIDEVHCLSEWGHDFRTSYLALANTIKEYAPSARFLALTATASSKVLKDIMTELEIKSENVITISSFTRRELEFNILKVSKREKKDALLASLKKFNTDENRGATVVFTQTVDGQHGCYELSQMAETSIGVKSAFYSGRTPKNYKGISYTKAKDDFQRRFMADELDVLFATKAFGMGIDKPNIRKTIHYGIPNSLESFYQEAGRAGRDKQKSECLVLYTPDELSQDHSKILFGIDTKKEVMKKIMSETNGDLNTLFFFMNLNLMEVNEEAELIYNFYSARLLGDHREVIIDFGGLEEKTEKMIYRLALLGVVTDWTVDWKSRIYLVQIADWTEESVLIRLSSYIKKYDYTFTLDSSVEPPAHYEGLYYEFHSSNQPFLKRVITVLLHWYNDNVIYSRKRSMLIMKEYADEFTDSATLQQRIEVYFKRNDDVYFLENVVAQESKLMEWYRIFYVEEEGKESRAREHESLNRLKITAGRFLESYRDDISLNLITGFIYLIENNFDNLDGEKRLSSAIRVLSDLRNSERHDLLISVLRVGNDFLDQQQKAQLSDVLSKNGYGHMEDLKKINSYLNDGVSYNYMIKELHSLIREKAAGGYPWET